MALVVSDNSIPFKLKAALLGAIPAVIILLHALGYDWGATGEEEQVARDSAAALAATAVVVLAFALYAHFKKTTVGEPVAVSIAVGGVLAAATTLVLAFDWATEGVTLAVASIIGVVLLPFGITFTRAEVRPVTTVQKYANVEPQDHVTDDKGESLVGLLIALACIAIIVFVIVVLVN